MKQGKIQEINYKENLLKW